MLLVFWVIPSIILDCKVACNADVTKASLFGFGVKTEEVLVVEPKVEVAGFWLAIAVPSAGYDVLVVNRG